MKHVTLYTVFLLALAFAATSRAAESKTVALKNAKGEQVGTAQLTQLADGVKVELEVHGLPPGEHALHFHEKGGCVPPEFKSAGGHFTVGTAKHGFDTKGGPHAGDMANFFVGANGRGKVEVVNTRVSLKPGPASLLKPGGTSLVIHEKPDDYKSQPAGDAGGRLACGEIK